jgi:hypothetical protein
MPNAPYAIRPQPSRTANESSRLRMPSSEDVAFRFDESLALFLPRQLQLRDHGDLILSAPSASIGRR